MTKDSVTITVDAVVFFRVFNPTASVVNVSNAFYSTQLLAATTLRNILGTKSLHEILREKDQIAHSMQETLDVATDNWFVIIWLIFLFSTSIISWRPMDNLCFFI